jgi:[ribosomal protein S5]-alanine N-acetyltransferase
MQFCIETERLIIRDLREKDAEIIAEQFADPAIRNQILAHQADKDYNREYVKRGIIVASQQPRNYFALAVTLKDSGTMIGSCSIYKVYSESIDTELGWNFGKAFWGKGYATETTKALLRIGFELNVVNRISAECFADNQAAIRVLEKVGMTRYNSNTAFQWLRALRYHESRPIVRYGIWRHQWLKFTTN